MANPVEVKTSVFALVSTLFSAVIGWINISTIGDTIIIALISTIVGFFGTKLLRYIDKKIRFWYAKKFPPKA